MRMATMPMPCATIRCSSWRWGACRRARRCARSPLSRGWVVRCRLTVRPAVRLRVLRRRQARILRGLRGTSEFGLQLRKLILETFVLRCQLLLLGAKSGVLRAQLFDHRHGDGERGLTLEANCNRCRGDCSPGLTACLPGCR